MNTKLLLMISLALSASVALAEMPGGGMAGDMAKDAATDAVKQKVKDSAKDMVKDQMGTGTDAKKDDKGTTSTDATSTPAEDTPASPETPVEMPK